MKMLKGPLMSLPKHPLKQMIQLNQGTTQPMIGCSDTKGIKDYFFMDTFFATKKGGQSSRGHTCCQLFVTDKGFIYVVSNEEEI